MAFVVDSLSAQIQKFYRPDGQTMEVISAVARYSGRIFGQAGMCVSLNCRYIFFCTYSDRPVSPDGELCTSVRLSAVRYMAGWGMWNLSMQLSHRPSGFTDTSLVEARGVRGQSLHLLCVLGPRRLIRSMHAHVQAVRCPGSLFGDAKSHPLQTPFK